MQPINQVKEQPQTDTPLLLFECVLSSGDIERWCSHEIEFNQNRYSARVLKHNVFDLQLSSDDASDGPTQLTVTLANADSELSELNATVGIKGAQLTVYFAFADLRTMSDTTENTVLFRGIAGDPDEITENSFTISFINKLSLQRVPIPDTRIQRSCGWSFPSNYQERTEARSGKIDGKVSRLQRCGYSADLPGGHGSLLNGDPFVSCDKSRSQCQSRGMFDKDENGNVTSRFGGFEFVPSAISVRTAGDKTNHLSPVLSNSAKYNDPVPMVYGCGWLRAPIVFARNDGNLTHTEVLLGIGPITGLIKVVVNDIEIPEAASGQDMSATGWYSLVSAGDKAGMFNLDFADQSGNPLGDPHGSMACLSVVVPNRICSGASLPVVEVLLQGIKVDTYDSTGLISQNQYSNNPAWIILNILLRCGWGVSQLNLPSFFKAADYCGTLIATKDLNGQEIKIPRFECNLILTKRQSAATVVRGIRVAASLMLRYGSDGLLETVPETTLADQQLSLPDGSNSTEMLDGGWPAYEFSDGSAGYSGILRSQDGSSSLRLSSRSIAETSNRLSVEFQDSTNEYQQDSLSLIDSVDCDLIGYEVSSQSTAVGISNFSQASRVLLRQLDKLTKGNLFVQFDTSFKALKVRPGDIIALTYLKEGFERTAFRVVKLSPAVNYRTVTVLAQLHNDDWYSDDPAVLGGAGRQPSSQVSIPHPLVGTVPKLDSESQFGSFDFGVSEEMQTLKDGTAIDRLTVSFSQPTKLITSGTGVALVSLAPQIDAEDGNLQGGTTFYYAVTSVDSFGQEGSISFTVPARLPAGAMTYAVSVLNLSFPSSAVTFNVYRGSSPQLLYRIAEGISVTVDRFKDTGLPNLPSGPPDRNFDHANFFYRYEFGTVFSPTGWEIDRIVYDDMGAADSAYIGMVARVLSGPGKGQERSIIRNDTTTLFFDKPWQTIPNAESVLVVCEPSWHFAAVSAASPVQFEIPYRAGSFIQISGRSANVHNQESSADLCPLTRIALGQTQQDAGAPYQPVFSISAPGAGILSLSQVGFSDLTNAATIASGTLTIYSWNELNTRSGCQLLNGLDTMQTEINYSSLEITPLPGSIWQIGSELVEISSVDQQAKVVQVFRGVLGSETTAHLPGETILLLTESVVIVPFAPGFFLNRASVNFIHSITLPDVRICAAAMFVSNSFGDSQAETVCFTRTPEAILRTLSGGQFALQVDGFLTTQNNATSALLIETSHAVRDIRASLSEPATNYSITVDILQNGTAYCSLVIPSGTSNSQILSGISLPPLLKEATITANVTTVQTSGSSAVSRPGRDLTITIRL